MNTSERASPTSSKQLVEQLAGGADERDPELVLLRARRLADEHEVGVRVAGPEDDLRPRARELGQRVHARASR